MNQEGQTQAAGEHQGQAGEQQAQAAGEQQAQQAQHNHQAQQAAGEQQGQAGDQGLMQQAQEVDWSKALNPDGTFTEAAHKAGLDEHWKSIGAMQKSYKELQAHKFGYPDENWSPERVAEFRKGLGVPEQGNAEAYGIEVPEEISQYLPKESLDRIAQKAHESHTPPQVLQSIFFEYAEIEKEALAKQQQEVEAERTEREKRLAEDPAFTGANNQAAKETATNVILNLADKLGVDRNDPELLELGSSPLMMRMMHRVAGMTSQDGMPSLRGESDLRSNEEKASDIMTNPNNPEYQRYMEGDPAVQKKVLRLMGAPA